MNNITIELCKEDRFRLDTLNAALTLIVDRLDGINAANEAKGLIETKVVDEPISNDLWDTQGLHQDVAEAPQEVVEEQTPPAEEIAQDEPTVTKPDILAKVIELCGKGKKAEAKDVITTYADSVSDLPDSALAEVWDKLIALEG